MVNGLRDRRKKTLSTAGEGFKKLVVLERIKCTYNVKRKMLEEAWLSLPREISNLREGSCADKPPTNLLSFVLSPTVQSQRKRDQK